MEPDPISVYIERHEPSRNMARFYALSAEVNLFGEMLVSRRWGRIGTHGQRRDELVANGQEAVERLRTLLGAKLRRGYSAPIPPCAHSVDSCQPSVPSESVDC